MFELFALGMAQIADPRLFQFERRKNVPQAQVKLEVPVVRVPNLADHLNKIRQEAWKSVDKVRILG